METQEAIEDQTEDNDEIEEVSAPAEVPKMQTFSRLPGGEESDSERIKRIESLLDQISIRLGDEDDNRASYDTMIQSFNALKTKTEVMIHNLEHEVEYTRTLDEKVKRKNVELDNIQLKKALLEEQGRMTLALEEFKVKITEVLGNITTSFNSMDKTLTDNCNTLQQKANDIKDLKDQIDDILINYNKELNKGAMHELTLLKTDCNKMLEACNIRVGEIKDSVMSFLKICHSQNQDLIKKIPEQRRKFSWLDVIVYVLCGVCITGMVLQMIL